MRRATGVVMCLVMVVSCGDGADSAASADPWGLSSIVMPASEAEVRAVLAAMPAEIGGIARQEDGFEHGTTIYYGGLGDEYGISFFAQAGDSLPRTDDGEPMSPIEWTSAMSASDVFVVTAEDLDPAGGLVWIAASTTSTDEPDGETTVYVAAWGEPGGEWVFFAGSESAVARDAFVEAFVEAVG